MTSLDNIEYELELPDKQIGKPGPLWRNRDYMLLWSGRLVSSFGSKISMFAVPLIVLALTHSPAQAALLEILETLPLLALSLPAGALVDRWNRKWIMIVCDFGRALALGSVALAFGLGHLSLWWLGAVALLDGTFSIFFTLAQSACLPHVVREDQLSDAIARNQSIFATSQLFGSVLAGLCYQVGRAFPFLMDAISYVISMCSLCFVKTPLQGEPPRRQQKVDMKGEILEGIRWLWQQPLLRYITFLTWGLLIPCVGYTLIILVLAQQQHASSFAIGLIMASGGLGNIAGTLIAGPLLKRFRLGQIFVVTMWVWVLTWLPLALAPNLVWLGIANVAGFIVVPVYFVAQMSSFMKYVPDHLRGRVNSVFSLIIDGSVPLGVGVTGVLLQFLGPVSTILIMFVPQFLLVIGSMFYRPLRAA